jgi:ABC-type dipeptide/oligopeptide/nickel transport system permease subunit
MAEETTVPAMRAPAPKRDNPFTRSVAGVAGLIVLAVLVVACVGTLPWTLSAPEPGASVRYDEQNLAANRLPPTWMMSLPDDWADPDVWGTPDARAKGAAVAGYHAAAAERAARSLEPGQDGTPRPPDEAAIRDAAPHFLFGTDNLGRDVFIRSLAGGGVSIGIGIAAAAISVLIGTLYGALAGYVGGKTDAVMMRVVDVLYGLPYILLVVLLAVAGDALVDRYDNHLKAERATERWAYVFGQASEQAADPIGDEQPVGDLPASVLIPGPGEGEELGPGQAAAREAANEALLAHAAGETSDHALARALAKADPDFAAAERYLLWLVGGEESAAASIKAGATRAGLSIEGLAPSTVTSLEVIVLLAAIGGVSWLTMARVIRGQVLSLKARPFMEAARAMGVPVHAQFARHLLPNLIGPIVVYATLTVPQAVLQESFLSFLGIGVQQPLPSWGNLAAEGLNELNTVTSRWWLLVFPCLLLGITLLALNFVGEGLREAFDPKRARR